MPDQMYDQVKQLADLNSPPVKKSSAFGTLIILLIFLAGLGVAGYAGFDWWRSRPSTPTVSSTPTPTATPFNLVSTITPTSTSVSPTLAPTPTSLKIQILNGTGVAGMAGKVKDLLTASGYANVVTGNAQAYEYETTVIMAKPTVQSQVPALQTLLAKSYQMDDQKNNLDASNPYDIVIIVGKK